MSSTTAPTHETLSIADVMADLEAGRSQPLRRPDRLTTLQPRPRPTLGGRSFLRAYLTARALGRVHPRLARRALERLWFTPWVHPAALAPVHDLPEDAAAWSLATADGRLHGYVAGAGPTVVLVHGWAGRGADWRHLAADLAAAGRRVVVPDLPAHGTTAGRRTDLFELGRAMTAVLDHERPVAVVTHSMGFPSVMVAIEGGAHVPSRLVALAPGRRIAHALAGFAHRARLRPALVAELRRGIEAAFGSDVWEVLDVDRVLPGLDVDGLVIHDRDDDEVPLDDALAVSTQWRGARLVTTDGLGHRRIVRDEQVRRLVVESLTA